MLSLSLILFNPWPFQRAQSWKYFQVCCHFIQVNWKRMIRISLSLEAHKSNVMYLQTKSTTPPQISAVKRSLRKKGMAVCLTWIYLFSFIKQSREATSSRRMRLPPTAPGKVKEGSTQEEQGWNWSGPFKLSGVKNHHHLKLQSSPTTSHFHKSNDNGEKKVLKHMKNHLYN